MATIQFNIDPFPYGIDNTQRRLIVYGTIEAVPDTPGGTFTQVTQYRIFFSPLEPLKSVPLMPHWIFFDSAQVGWFSWNRITSVSVAANVMTVSCSNNFKQGDTVRLDGLTGAASQFNAKTVVVTSNAPGLTVASTFTAKVGVVSMPSTTVVATATPMSYADGMPAQGFLSTTAVPSTITNNISYRAEFMRSYQ